MYFFIAATRPMLGARRAGMHERMRMPMRIDVRDRGVKSTEALRNYVGLRLMSVLDHLVRRVDGVTVCLADVHAPEGGINKRCRMLALLPSGEVCVEETHPGLYAAIDRAAERLAHGVALDFMSTGAAVRTYNILLAEERKVAAALIAVADAE